MNNLSAKMGKLKALQNGRGVQYLLNEAFKILGNPVMTHDMEYKVIAYTGGVATDDHIWNEFAETGTVSADTLRLYKNECFFEAAANTKKVAFLVSDKLKYDRIFGKLFTSGSIQVGAACMVEACVPFDEDSPALFEAFCDILSQELGESEYYRNYGQKYQETLINELISGSIVEKETYTAHVESIYINLSDTLYLAVADIAQCGAGNTKFEHFRDLFKQARPEYKYSVYNRHIVIIISAENKPFITKRELGKLDNIFEEYNIYVGISSCFYNLFDLQKFYNEAVCALTHRPQNDGSRKVFMYDANE